MPATDRHSTTAKKATNLSINSELLAEARAMKINLSAMLEKALTDELADRKRQRWLQENADAIQHCNEYAEKHGLFADKHRVL